MMMVVLILLILMMRGKVGAVESEREHSLPTNVACVYILASSAYVG